jgi:kynurenine formamidase
MSPNVPTEKEVLAYFHTLSNWGRWGSDDQLGTLNLLTPDKVLQAVKLVKEGLTVSCGRTVYFDPSPDAQRPPVHFMIESGDGWATGDKVTSRALQVATDYVGMTFHGFTITHLDSLAHFFWQGQMYNGSPAKMVSTDLGATVGSVELASKGIVSRGILVDVPMVRGVDWLERGEGVLPEDILDAEKRCGFTVESGDILLIRTGQLHRRNVQGPVNPREKGSSGCHVSCLPLLHSRDVAVLGSDTGNDVIPSIYPALTSPIHQVGIVAMGMWILDNPDLEELADTCRRLNRWEFMFTTGPLRLHNTTGSPVNPTAIF